MRASQLLTDLGFLAAETRTLHGMLAGACAAKDGELARMLAQDLLNCHGRFNETYLAFLAADTPS
jgi:hypothetical protein